MAELPEIVRLSRQMHEILKGRTLSEVELRQEKNLNMPPEDWIQRSKGRTIQSVGHRGKWILLYLTEGWVILLSLGMGADVLYHAVGDPVPDAYQVRVSFAEGGAFTIRFWWFGKFHLIPEGELPGHELVGQIAMDPFDEAFEWDYFQRLLRGKRTQVKAFLVDQKQIGGIGNMYAHDILFTARLHPKRKCSDLTQTEQRAFFDAILEVLGKSRDLGAFAHEKDFYGQGGGYNTDHFLVAYRENQPCPVCGGEIRQIKAGGTASYLCPHCQKAGG